MIPHLAITSIVILLLAFELNSVRAALLIGEEIAGPSGARHIQDAVTPPLATVFGIIIHLSYLVCLVWVFFVHGWLLGIIFIPVSFIAVGIVKKIIPSPDGEFFRGIIVRSMMNRYADFEKEGDPIRSRAMADLLDKLGFPLPDSLK